MRLDSQKIQNPYTAELQAIAAILKGIGSGLPPYLNVLVTTSNLTVLQVLSNPARQLG